MIRLILCLNTFTIMAQLSLVPAGTVPRRPDQAMYGPLNIPLNSPLRNLSGAYISARPGAVSPACRNMFKWDLSYESVLNSNGITQDAWLSKWIKNYKSPVQKIISSWRGEPIVSAFLIEHPAFNAGEHTSLLVIRTQNHAYRWYIVEGKYQLDKDLIATQTYDDVYRSLRSWKQGGPLMPDETPPGGVAGYSGFLSLYEHGKSRQLLLSLRDFFLFDVNKNPDEVEPGRLAQVLEQLT